MSQKRWTNREAEKVIVQWRRSRLSLGEFARKHGWEEQRLRYWAARVGEKNERVSKTTPTRLLPGVVIDTKANAGVSVVLPRGVSIEARRIEDVTAEWVVDVVRALEAGR